jgi:tetratricopeptide (TPR) repeat protein
MTNMMRLPFLRQLAGHAVLAALMLVAASNFASVVAQSVLPATATAAAPLALQLEPAESFEGNYLAAIIAGSARDTRAAALYYREALRADPNNSELMERAFVALISDGAMADAFRIAERLIKREPENSLAHLALGIRSIKNKQFSTARRHLERGNRSRTADITATLLTSWSWLGSGNLPRALSTIERLKSESAYNVFRDYHAGLIADVAGHQDEAEKRFKSAYGSDKTTLRIIDMYGRFEANRGARDSALALYEGYNRLLSRQPIVEDAIEKLKAGKPLARTVNNAQEGAAEVLYGLGSIGSRQDEGIIALVYLQLALYLDSDHVMALVTLGDVLERAKQTDRAIAIYKQVPVDSPLRPSVDIQVGISLEVLERSDEAIAHITQLIARDAKDVDAHAAIGNIYRNRKRFAEAVDAYNKAIEAAGAPIPNNWGLYYSRGIALERTKQWPKAEADFKKALELIPNNLNRDKALVLNYLGYSWVDQHLNIDEAFQMLRQAVELSPREGYIIDSLGWAYYRLGRYDDAVRELERAIELKPGDPVINDHLGDAYWKVGRKLEAEFQWAHARDSKPEADDLVKILKKIENGFDEDKPATAIEVKSEDKKNGG